MSALGALLLRDIRLAVRVGGGAWIGVLFFLIVVTLVPFAAGPDLALLARIGPAILWLGALLSNLLALDRWAFYASALSIVFFVLGIVLSLAGRHSPGYRKRWRGRELDYNAYTTPRWWINLRSWLRRRGR